MRTKSHNGNTATVRRTAVREAGVSRHHGAPIECLLKPHRPSQHYHMRSSRAAKKGSPIMPRDTSLSDDKFFQSWLRTPGIIKGSIRCCCRYIYIYIYIVDIYIYIRPGTILNRKTITQWTSQLTNRRSTIFSISRIRYTLKSLVCKRTIMAYFKKLFIAIISQVINSRSTISSQFFPQIKVKHHNQFSTSKHYWSKNPNC